MASAPNASGCNAAYRIYQRVLERYPAQPRTRMSLGHALKTLGRQADAIAAYRSAAKLAPGLGEAYWSLANLKTFRFDDAQIAAMRRAIDQGPESIGDRYHLSFALGKALEDRGEYDESFHCYAQGNAARRKTVRWDAECLQATFRQWPEFQLQPGRDRPLLPRLRPFHAALGPSAAGARAAR